jgi:hypothetical protein
VSTTPGPVTESPSVETPQVERRASPRYTIIRRCFVWPPGARGIEGWRSIAYNISATGIGLVLPFPLPTGTVVHIEAWGLPGAGRLPARIVRSALTKFTWFCGCEFLSPLSDDDLQAWVRGPQSGRPRP